MTQYCTYQAKESLNRGMQNKFNELSDETHPNGVKYDLFMELTLFSFEYLSDSKAHASCSIACRSWYVIGRHVAVLTERGEPIRLAKSVLGLGWRMVDPIVGGQAEILLIA